MFMEMLQFWRHANLALVPFSCPSKPSWAKNRLCFWLLVFLIFFILSHILFLLLPLRRSYFLIFLRCPQWPGDIHIIPWNNVIPKIIDSLFRTVYLRTDYVPVWVLLLFLLLFAVLSSLFYLLSLSFLSFFCLFSPLICLHFIFITFLGCLIFLLLSGIDL